MTFDPTKPVEDSPLDAVEMRNQFNALKALIDDLQLQLAPLVPVVTRSTVGQWLLTYSGPRPAYWNVWMRSSASPAWSDNGEIINFPVADADIVPDGVTWWQVKFSGADGNDNVTTLFSNVISSGPVPA